MQPVLITDAELVEELLVVSAKWVKVTIKRELQRRRVGCRTDTNPRDHFTRWTLQRPWPLDDPGGFISNWKSVKQQIENLKNWLQEEHYKQICFSEGSQKECSRSKLGSSSRTNQYDSRVQRIKHIKSAKNIWRRCKKSVVEDVLNIFHYVLDDLDHLDHDLDELFCLLRHG